MKAEAINITKTDYSKHVCWTMIGVVAVLITGFVIAEGKLLYIGLLMSSALIFLAVRRNLLSFLSVCMFFFFRLIRSCR